MPSLKLATLLGTALLFCVPHAVCQTVRIGNCPTITLKPPVTTPDPLNFVSGDAQTTPFTWFVHKMSPPFLRQPLHCMKYVFTLKPDSNPVIVLVDISGSKWLLGRKINIHGEMTTKDFQTWSVNFRTKGPTSTFLPSAFPTGYSVLGIEPIAKPTWMVLYSCDKIGPINLRSVHILSKNQQMSSADQTAALAVVSEAGLSTSSLITVDQTVCLA